MLSKDLIGKPVETLAPLIEKKEISPVELTEAILDHTEKTEGTINAFMEVYREDALENAKKAEEEIANGTYRGMYHGIPMAIKDNVYFKDKISTKIGRAHV